MDITKLEQKTYRGYKQICDTVGAKYCSGKQKIIQLADWRRYFDWTEHTRYRWEITEIYDEPKPKIDGRVNNGGARTNIYADHIDYLILQECRSTDGFDDNRDYVKTIRRIAFEFGLVNDNFLDLKREINFYIETLEINEWYLYNFFNSAYDRIKRMIVKSLDRLSKQKLIVYQVAEQYKDTNDGFVKTVTPEIQQRISTVEQEVLNQMGISDIQMAIKLGRANEFYSERDKRLNKQFGIAYLYVEHDFAINITSEVDLINRMEEIGDKYGSGFDHSAELNRKLRERIIKGAEKAHETMKQKYHTLISTDGPFVDADDKHRMIKNINLDMKRRPEYIDAVKKCVDYFLKIDR